MLPTRVDTMLRNYREYAGRVLHLENHIASLSKTIEELRATALADAASPGSQNMDGMPHGTAVGQPTERIAIMFADGFTPDYIVKLEMELEACRAEYDEKVQTVIFVDAWLKGLTEKERWIIEKQVIDAVTWRELIVLYARDFGEPRTKEALKKLRVRTMDKIYHIAE